MLFLEQTTQSFIECVSHVTLGKWIHVGMILVKSDYYSRIVSQSTTQQMPRTPSTYIDLKPIIPVWNKVVNHVANAQLRREQVLAKINCDEEESWGRGCLIFAPVRYNHNENLKCRYLPFLEQVNICAPRPTDFRSKINKIYVNQLVMDAVMQWKAIELNYDDCDNYDSYIKIINYFCLNAQMSNNSEKTLVTSDFIKSNVLNSEVTKAKVGDILRMLEKANLITYAIKGRKRHRGWEVNNDFNF
jgi:hypothetical protein